MAKSKSVTDFNIRHRLVGAVVLFGLGVIIIPVILQGNGSGIGTKSGSLTQEVQQWIVGTEEAETYVSRVVPVGESDTELSIQPVQGEGDVTPQLKVIEETVDITTALEPETQTADTEPEIVAAAQPENEPVAIEQPAPVVKQTEPEPKPPEQIAGIKPENVSRGWVVQVGTFSKPENAQNLITKLNKNGFESRYEVVTTDAGQATRVWIGPYEKRVTAGKALNVVKDKTGVKGFIKTYP